MEHATEVERTITAGRHTFTVKKVGYIGDWAFAHTGEEVFFNNQKIEIDPKDLNGLLGPVNYTIKNIEFNNTGQMVLTYTSKNDSALLTRYYEYKDSVFKRVEAPAK